MPSHFITRKSRGFSSIPITVDPAPDQWKDIYKIPAPALPAIPVGSILSVHLRKQLESPPTFPTGIAVLKQFVIYKPAVGGVVEEIPINLGGRTDVNGQLGENITRASHYGSTDDGCLFIVRDNPIPEGCKLAWQIRAKTSTVAGGDLEIWDKGYMVVEIRWPDASNNTFLHLA